jgi:flagellar motor switch protein FliM
MTKDYPVYDFVTASKVERPLSAALKVWLDKFAKMFADRWKEFAPTQIQVVPTPIDSVTFEATQSKWNRPAIAAPIQINQGAVNGMIVSKRTDILILLMEILCETLTEKPEDRELTSVESSLCQLFFEQSAATFGEAWPQKEILPVDLGEMDPHPNRCRLFPPANEVLVTGFDLQTSSCEAIGPARVQWIFSKNELSALLGVDSNSSTDGNPGIKIPVDNITQIMVEMTANLGTTELDMNDLMKLTPGDIVKLDQRIEDPIVLLVNEKPVFEAWPGRMSDKCCLQVESIIS